MNKFFTSSGSSISASTKRTSFSSKVKKTSIKSAKKDALKRGVTFENVSFGTKFPDMQQVTVQETISSEHTANLSNINMDPALKTRTETLTTSTPSNMRSEKSKITSVDKTKMSSRNSAEKSRLYTTIRNTVVICVILLVFAAIAVILFYLFSDDPSVSNPAATMFTAIQDNYNDTSTNVIQTHTITTSAQTFNEVSIISGRSSVFGNITKSI